MIGIRRFWMTSVAKLFLMSMIAGFPACSARANDYPNSNLCFNLPIGAQVLFFKGPDYIKHDVTLTGEYVDIQIYQGFAPQDDHGLKEKLAKGPMFGGEHAYGEIEKDGYIEYLIYDSRDIFAGNGLSEYGPYYQILARLDSADIRNVVNSMVVC